MMLFGGMQKNSFIDYPGRISCVLFLPECNFHCPYCHNPSLVKGNEHRPDPVDEEAVIDFLKKNKAFIEGVVITGGEPTLHRELPFLCDRIKKMGYPIKLDTNGSRPRVIKELLERGLIDYVAMDVKTSPCHYTPHITEKCNPQRILSSIRIIMECSSAYEFRTTCVRPIVDEGTIDEIVKIIDGASLYALQAFNGKNVLSPDFFLNRKCAFDRNELMDLKAIAESHVERCILR